MVTCETGPSHLLFKSKPDLPFVSETRFESPEKGRARSGEGEGGYGQMPRSA